MLKPFFKINLCNFGGPDFIKRDHRHIVTGDLRMIKNHTLRKSFTKSPKYRENNSIS